MKKYRRVLQISLLAALAVVALAGWYLHRHTISVLQPAGQIGTKERNLIIFCALISAVIVIPVFSILAYFAWQYREGNRRARYDPDLSGNRTTEMVWWIVPGIIITIISVVTWRSSYALDPFKQLASTKPTLHVKVIALDWKWLFIYSGQNVASVNEAAIPVNTPVEFDLTSDAVMTSFWDPQLGGQMYAMPGMSTKLNLMANKTGNFPGWAANISGKGFARMTFAIKSMPQSKYNAWIASAKRSGRTLTYASYAALARPGTQAHPSYYAWVTPGLYDTTVMKYMAPTNVGNSLYAAGTGI